MAVKRKAIFFTTLLIAMLMSMAFGVTLHKSKMFPYKYLKMIFNYINVEQGESLHSWSIGIFEGSSPFNMATADGVSNPVLTKNNVNDIKAGFVADPFLVFHNGKFFLFFEVYNNETSQGDIAYAESDDLKSWEYKGVVIDEEFHLSYPYIFEWKGNYYLIPESYQDLSVRLYKSVLFPTDWEYIGNLLSGYRYVDPSIFFHDGMWWLFVSTVDMDVLNLYFSEDLLTGWKAHPMNPIVKFDKNISRPAGRVINYNGMLCRLAQDCDPSYGSQVFAFEISEISEKTYNERIVFDKPILEGSNKGWNATGMHHADIHKIGKKWVGAVDGRSK